METIFEKLRAIVNNLGKDDVSGNGVFEDGVFDDAIKMKCRGGPRGIPWDHGVYTGVRKVYVTCDLTGVSHIMVEYDKAGNVEMRQNGDMKGEHGVEGQQHEFLLDYPDEYITSVWGTCEDELSWSLRSHPNEYITSVGDTYPTRVRSLSFKTSKGRTSPAYGRVGWKTFVLKSNGRALVGFHGRAGSTIDAIGAYFDFTCEEKLQGKGGDGGESWDDGAFDGVRKIYVGQGENGIAFVKFVYDKNNREVLGQHHGENAMLGYEEFELEYPSEYITAVEGCYGKIIGSKTEVITMLKFQTNVRTSPSFGFKSTSNFILGKEGHKIVGFHGRSSHELHQFGVSVALILGFNKFRGVHMENPHLSDCLEVTMNRISATSPELAEVFTESLFSALLVGTKLLVDADQKTNRYQVKRWLSEFQDASFQAENLLEDISEEDIGQHSVYLSPFFKFNSDQLLLLRYMAHVVAKIEHHVGKIHVSRKKENTRAVEAQLKRSNMSPFSPDRVFGREADKVTVIEFLLSRDIVQYGIPNVISVKGMPGIGKTTLVEVVYNDESVTRHFDHKVWIYVRQDFNVFRVTKEILQQITSAAATSSSNTEQPNFTVRILNVWNSMRALFDPKHHSEDLPSLQAQLMATLAGKKFLLVLDDFWSESSSEWKLFLSAFTGGSEGSKIVLTTQSDTATSITRAAQTHQLMLMTKTECWELISTFVFGYISSMDQELDRVGKIIAEQCKGSPLVATTIASHLRSEPDLKKFYDVSNSFPLYTTGAIEVLKQSYDSLPCHLKRCFAFCSIFPKGYLIDRKNLVLLWMASDLLYQPGSNQSLEDIGNKYLDDLVARSFLQPTEYKKKFTMHDLMNDLAKTAAGDFCFRLEDGRLLQIPKRVRHLSICGKLGDSSIASYFTRGDEYLRTFLPIIVMPPPFESSELAEKALIPLPDFSTRALSCLQILSLSHYHIIKLPTSFKRLKQLRYLDLSNTEVEEIPEFVFTLRNLQTLFLSNCRQLRRLTQEIVQLINLRYLDLLLTPLIEMPRGISNLRSLQRLSNFVIGKLSGAGLQELRELSHLRGKLHISELQNVVSLTEDSDPGLREKPLLKKLVLTWSVKSYSSNAIACDHTEVLKMLQPHHNLEKISINCYEGVTFPRWLGNTSFISMTSVSLTSCSLCISLPPLGQLPYLRHVKIEKFEILQKVGLEFFYGENKNVSPLEPFPYLQSLTFSDMPRWEEWCCPELDGGIFPCLYKLTIRSCLSLAKKFPKGLPDFTQVTISDCPLKCEEDIGKLSEPESSSQPSQEHLMYSLTSLSNDSGSTSGIPQQDQEEENFIVENVHELKKLPASLKRLHIESFSEESLPESLVQDFPSLEELIVVNCHSLETFPGRYSSTTLKTLYIRECMTLDLLRSLQTVHIFPQLENLFIGNSCSTLTSFPLPLFPNLKSLSIGHCENLRSLSAPSFCGVVSLALEALEITGCPNLESFPSLETPKLTSMLFSNCRKLKVLPVDSRKLTSLLSIHVNDCPELEGIPLIRFQESLRTLSISGCQKLRLTLGWRLPFLGNLRDINIEGGHDDIESFPKKELLPRYLYSLRISKFKNLRTLDHKGLEDLPTLAMLEISGCDKLASLSDKGLPSSLSLLRINGSPLLKEKISRRDIEWFKIKHIQLVEIDGEELPRRRKRT